MRTLMVRATILWVEWKETGVEVMLISLLQAGKDISLDQEHSNGTEELLQVKVMQ